MLGDLARVPLVGGLAPARAPADLSEIIRAGSRAHAGSLRNTDGVDVTREMPDAGLAADARRIQVASVLPQAGAASNRPRVRVTVTSAVTGMWRIRSAAWP